MNIGGIDLGRLFYNGASAVPKQILYAGCLLRGALIIFFFFMAAKNLSGDEKMAADFARWGYPEWFRILTGLLQLTGAVLLLSPAVAFFGAALIGAILVGAIGTHLLHDPPQTAIPAAIFLIISFVLSVLYRPGILR